MAPKTTSKSSAWKRKLVKEACVLPVIYTYANFTTERVSLGLVYRRCGDSANLTAAIANGSSTSSVRDKYMVGPNVESDKIKNTSVSVQVDTPIISVVANKPGA